MEIFYFIVAMKDEHKGILFGALAAIFYGTNPLGALNLIEAKLIPISIIFYRMMFATLFVLIALLVSKKSLKFPKENLPKTISLGILFAASACLLYESFIGGFLSLTQSVSLFNLHTNIL